MKNDIEARVSAIEERNRRVELDKEWETSWTHRLSISALTYVVVVVYLLAIDNHNPFINAAVPALGYMLSTLVLKNIRSNWHN